MTLLVSWLAVQEEGPSSMYIATDSRITFTYNSSIFSTYDNSRKVVLVHGCPDIIRYCGDVYIVTQILGQAITAISTDASLVKMTVSDERWQWITKMMKLPHQNYHKATTISPYSILYCSSSCWAWQRGGTV